MKFDLELLTEDDEWMIGCEIPAEGDLTGVRQEAEPDVGIMSHFWEDIRMENVMIEVTKDFETEWRPLPKDLEPYLDRWIQASAEWLCQKLDEQQ